jgi:carnosine synthase
MEYIEGTEHDVDIIIFQRQLIAAFVSDNGPTRQGRFTETTALMPSCLES